MTVCEFIFPKLISTVEKNHNPRGYDLDNQKSSICVPLVHIFINEFTATAACFPQVPERHYKGA